MTARIASDQDKKNDGERSGHFDGREAVIKAILGGQIGELGDLDSGNGDHDKIASEVYQRLCKRHGILDHIEGLTHLHRVHKGRTIQWDLIHNPERNPDKRTEEAPGDQNQNSATRDQAMAAGTPEEADEGELPKERLAHSSFFVNEHPKIRAYHLAVTDLFVEKALAYLEDQSKKYSRPGKGAYFISLLAIGAACGVATYQLFIDTQAPATWIQFAWKVLRGLTFYGLIILFSVVLSRLGRALLDQAERLLEKRHALRQGRLFIHLHEGPITIQQMEKAFSWNTTNSNAFGNMKTEAKAPTGSMLDGFFKAFPNALKAGVETTGKAMKREPKV